MAARGVVYPDIAAWCACLARATAEISRGRPSNLEWSRLFELLSFARVGVFSNKRSQRKSDINKIVNSFHACPCA